jgi:hypothetical protein
LFPISCLHCAGSGHKSNDIFEHLRHFLENEWQRKCKETGDSVPRKWEVAGKERPPFLK